MRVFFENFVDITILSILIYYIYNNVLNSNSITLIRGLLVLIVLYAFAYVNNLKTINWITNSIINIFPILIVIIFNYEIKKLIMHIGNEFNILNKFNNKKELSLKIIDEILKAVEYLSKTKRGSLICIEKKVKLNQLITKGTKINGEISRELLISIFEYETPLHDGAVIISDNKILLAGSFLPLSDHNAISKSFGTRHRAALGITEQSDAIGLITSEETGAISLTYNGKISYNLSIKELKSKLALLLV